MRHTRSMRPLLVRIHFYAGVFVGPFILIAALSGLLYSLSPQLEKLVYHDQLYTDVRGETLPLSQQLASARTVAPTATLAAIRPAAAPGHTSQVLFDQPGLDGRQLSVFVDPVTGEVKGELLTYGHSGQLPLSGWLRDLHGGLHLGEAGRVYSELAASWLWVILLAGLLMWWTKRRRGRPRWRPWRSGSARQRTLSWHAVVGTCVALGLLMLSATGLTWSRFAGDHVRAVREELGWKSPAIANDFGGGGGHRRRTGGDVVGVGPDGAARAAARVGISAPLQVKPPEGDHGYVVKSIDESWPARADTVDVDPQSGRVTEVAWFADWPFMAKLARWGIQLHMGKLFGVWNQLGLAVLAVSAGTMTVLGYRMWWLRRPLRGHRLRFGRPAVRGAWRRAPRAAVVALLVAAAGVGWFLPVLGVSLLAFLLVDVVVGLLAGRRGTRPPQGGQPSDDRVLVG